MASNSKPCRCGCGRKSYTESGYNVECQNECACGCGTRVKYAYAEGHRPKIVCSRCGKEFSPLTKQGDMCSQCRRHVREGRPKEQNDELVSARKMQAKAPDGKRWCSGCKRYRALKFFGKREEGYYSRCKPCHRKQLHERAIANKYNLSIEQYEEIKRRQGGKCAICRVATGAKKALAVDHDHTHCPGKTSCGVCVRGLLCSRCNTMLGRARDDVEFFQRAIEYLRNPPAQRR